MQKHLFYIIVFSFFLTSCNSLKKTQKQLASGQYDQAIHHSIHYLRKKKNRKKASEYKYLLWNAYQKAVDRDHRNIAFLKEDNNPAHLEKIYHTFLNLQNRQEKIRPLLPLKGYQFKMQNYNRRIINSKDQLSDYIYVEANQKLNSNNKLLIREAHEDFKYIESINPDYENTRVLLDQSYRKGLDFVLVRLKNNTQQVIPVKLQKQLLDIHEYQLDNYWTVHHGKRLTGVQYDFNLILSFDQIYMSPEQIKEVHIIKKKEIIDGKEYVLDEKGNVKKDAKGNDLKKDKIIKVKSTFHEYTQFKECTITAKSYLIDNRNKQTISKTPYSSSFVFEHIYATQTGDKRALTSQLIDLLNHRRIPFPSNEQMILDTGNDIKKQLGIQLKSLNF